MSTFYLDKKPEERYVNACHDFVSMEGTVKHNSDMREHFQDGVDRALNYYKEGKQPHSYYLSGIMRNYDNDLATATREAKREVLEELKEKLKATKLYHEKQIDGTQKAIMVKCGTKTTDVIDKTLADLSPTSEPKEHE